MSIHREDAVCPYCPPDSPPFTIPDIGMKFETTGDLGRDESVTFRATRPLWEIPMLEHLRLSHPCEWREVAERLGAENLTEAAVRGQVQAGLNAALRHALPGNQEWP